MKLSRLDKKAILSEFNLWDLSGAEREKVWVLIEKIFETRLLDFVLSNLTFEDQKKFVLISQDEEEKAWRFLGRKIDQVEEKIKREFERIKQDLKKEIEGLKND